jgi:DNA end-binding protein Ku
MPLRPHWKGYLKLSLVSCPVALYPAIAASERVSFRQVNKQTGNRLRQQLVDTVTGDVVQREDKGRGYDVGENQFLIVKDEELDAAREEARSRPFSAAPASTVAPRQEERSTRSAVAPSREEQRAEKESDEEELPAVLPPPPKIENNRTIELDRFVPRSQIDPRYLNTPYYIAPRDEVGQEAFAVIRDAMTGKDLVGLGRVVLASRERPIIVAPMSAGLCGITLRYAHEVRSEADYFADIPKLMLPDEMVRVAQHILETKRADFDTTYLEDRYRTVLVDMLRDKQARLPHSVRPVSPSAENVVSLMDALKRSLAAERPSLRSKPGLRRTAATSKPSPVRRSNARARRSV